MTAYSLNIDGEFQGLWHTSTQAKEASEKRLETTPEWEDLDGGGTEATFVKSEGLRMIVKSVKVLVCDDIEESAYKITIRAVRSGIFLSLEAITHFLGRSTGEEGGLLTDLIYIPSTDMWAALYWDQWTGIEIATVEKVHVQGVPEKIE